MLGNLYSFCSVTITKSKESTDFSRTTPVMILSIAPTLVEKNIQASFASKTSISTEKSLFWMSILHFSHHNPSQWHLCKVWFVSISIGYLTLQCTIPCLLNHPKMSFLIHMLNLSLEKKLITNTLQCFLWGRLWLQSKGQMHEAPHVTWPFFWFNFSWIKI